MCDYLHHNSVYDFIVFFCFFFYCFFLFFYYIVFYFIVNDFILTVSIKLCTNRKNLKTLVLLKHKIFGLLFIFS